MKWRVGSYLSNEDGTKTFKGFVNREEIDDLGIRISPEGALEWMVMGEYEPMPEGYFYELGTGSPAIYEHDIVILESMGIEANSTEDSSICEVLYDDSRGFYLDVYDDDGDIEVVFMESLEGVRKIGDLHRTTGSMEHLAKEHKKLKDLKCRVRSS